MDKPEMENAIMSIDSIEIKLEDFTSRKIKSKL